MSNKQLVILDLGGVLLLEAESNLHKAKSVNLQKILAGYLPKTRIFNRAFEFASLFCVAECKIGWILGEISGHEVVSKIKENIDKHQYASFFKDSYERDLIKFGIEFVLMPNLLVELSEVIHEGVEFVNRCKKSNIELGIISNWDPESFELLKDKFPEVFKLFNENNIIIPQMVGKAKPDVEIYDFAIKRASIPIEHCYFVDDSSSNVAGARNYGIKSVLHKNWHDTQNQLIKFGLNLY